MQWDRVHTFGAVDVGDLDAIELAEARVGVVSSWGIGVIGGDDASAGRGVIDSTLGGLGVCGFVKVGAAETVVAAGLPFPKPCRGAGGCQGRGYQDRGRGFRVDSQEHVQGQQACPHT